MGEKEPRNFLFIALVGVLVFVSLAFIFMPQKKSEAWTQSAESKKATTTKVTTIPLVAFIGDSFCDGTGVSTKLMRWSTLVSQELGWFEKNSCTGGAGYISKGGGGRDYRLISDEIFASLKPAVVVISGGKNDLGFMTEDGSEISDASCELFSGIKKAAPKAQIIVVSPFWDTTKVPAIIGRESSAIKACAVKYGAKFLSGAHRWLEGNEKLFDANVGAPNDEGQALIAQKFVAWYKANGLKT